MQQCSHSEAINVSVLRPETYRIFKNSLAKVFNKPLTRLIILSIHDIDRFLAKWPKLIGCCFQRSMVLLYSFMSASTWAYIITAFQKFLNIHVKIYS